MFLEEKEGKNIINVEYKSKKLPTANWNLLEEAKNYNGTVKFLTTNPYNIVIHTSNKGNNPREQIYYFNLDDKANGIMTMVNTKYKSMIDTVNNQAFHFCTCKSPINK